MPGPKTKIKELEQKVKTLVAAAERADEAEARLSLIEKKYRELKQLVHRTNRDILALRSAVDMPELYLDRDWNIVGYSGNFMYLTKEIVESANMKRHLSRFLRPEDFNKIAAYLKRVAALKNLPYDKGAQWKLRYEGPDPEDMIGKSWHSFRGKDAANWKIIQEHGRRKMIHSAHIDDKLDCYLISGAEYGGPKEDLKITFKMKTSGNQQNIRDISLLLSANLNQDTILPDLMGYTVCSGHSENTQAAIQRQAADLTTTDEVLESETEYQVTVERTGGRLRRMLKNLSTGREAPVLEVIDSNAIYDRHNYVGFTTFSGEMELYDIKIFTRKSRFSIEQFKIPFDVVVGIRDKKLEDRLFKLRLGIVQYDSKFFNTLLFEEITERVQAEKKLKQSEQYFRSLIENAYEFIAILDRSGEIRYTIPTVEKSLGYKTKDLTGRIIFDFIHPDDLPLVHKAFETLLARSGAIMSEELRICDKKGNWRIIEVTAKNCLDDPAVSGVVANAHEITERKLSQEALRESEERYRTLVETMNEGLARMDENGKLTFVNKAVFNVMGYSREDILGRGILDFLDETNAKIFLEQFEKREKGEASPYELLAYGKDKRKIYVKVSPRPVFDDQGEFRGSVVVLTDITERKLAEKALRESEERYRNLVETMKEGLMVADENLNIVFINDAICRITGYTKKEMLGSNVKNFLSYESLNIAKERLARRKAGAEDTEPYELVGFRKDKSKIYYHVSPGPLFDDQGRFTGSVLVISDITERKQAEEALQRGEAQLKSLINGIQTRIAFVNSDLEILIANKAAADPTGKNPEEIAGMKCQDVLCDAQGSCDGCFAVKTLEKGVSQQITRIDKNGRILDLKANPVFNSENKLLGAVIITEDITERVEAMEMLRRSEHRFRLLFENAGNPIYLVDNDGIVLMLNNQAVKHFVGKKQGNFVGKPLRELIPSELADRHMRDIRQAIETGRGLNVEYEAVLNDKKCWCKVNIQPYRVVKGSTCAQIIVHDITKIKLAQQALQQDRDSLEARVAESTAALRSSETLLQERLKQLTCLYNIRQEFDRDLTLDDTLMACAKHIREALDNAQDKNVIINLDHRWLAAGDQGFQQDNCLESILEIGGLKRGFIGVYSKSADQGILPFEQDLVKHAGASLSAFIQNRELRAQLIQTEKLAAAGSLAASVAHEVNNPLGAIKNSLYIIKRAISPKHEDFPYVELMDNEIDRVAAIIAQLYGLYLPSAQKMQKIDLARVAGNVLKMMEAKIRRQRIKIHNEVKSSRPRLNLPVTQVTQVLYNIILNAVQVMPRGGILSLGSTKSGGMILLSVSDTGPGIEDDVISHIFEPFFSTKTPWRNPAEGMGMGLSLSKSIVESLGGTIAVKTNLGRGTSFTLSFPIGLAKRFAEDSRMGR
ncbi:MAG TPA: PAS domain S-box protein [archaeon]|nr:PAS domain S-box protein [archaeon]